MGGNRVACTNFGVAAKALDLKTGKANESVGKEGINRLKSPNQPLLAIYGNINIK